MEAFLNANMLKLLGDLATAEEGSQAIEAASAPAAAPTGTQTVATVGTPDAGAQGAQPAEQPSIFATLLPFILIFAIFYFLVIRPQKKQVKKHNEMLSKLEKGNLVIMSNGIQGRIAEIKDNELKVEICQNPKVVISVQKGIVSSVVVDQEKNVE